MYRVLARLLPQLSAARGLVSAGLNIKQRIVEQVRHITQTIVLALVGAFFSLVAFSIGLIALYLWLARDFGPFVALGVIGLGTLVITCVLFWFAFLRDGAAARSSTPRPLSHRTASGARAADVRLDRLTQRAKDVGELVVGNTQSLFQHGPRKSVIGLLVLAGVFGLVLGRRL
jgi:hypothetical protein